MRSISFPLRSFSLNLQPPLAWITILAFVFFSTLCILAGAGSVLRIFFPVGAFAVGILLYGRYPILYAGFTWWLWFLSPLVRRLVDYRSGWDPQPLILLAPYLVSLITLATFLRHLPRSYRQGGLPFVIACGAVFYGFLMGIILSPSNFGVARATLDWLSPILFGFHLFVNWRDYPSYRQNMQRTFLWGVLITGSYGVFQYLVAPEWDRLWLTQSNMTSSGGQAEALGLRVFSTMHAYGPFAAVMAAGLLLLFSSRQQALRIPTAGVGYLALLLSTSRSAWLSWFVGLLTLLASLKSRLQMRLIITIIVMAVCVLPLTTIAPFSETINSRLQSFLNLKQDSSFNARTGIYNENFNLALSNGLGNGIGSTFTLKNNGKLQTVVIDSGILDTFFTLGWFGAVPYLGAIMLLFFNLFQSSEGSFDLFASAARAISFGIFMQMPLGTSTVGLPGITLWAFLGIGMAAQKYHRYQRTIKLKQNSVKSD